MAKELSNSCAATCVGRKGNPEVKSGAFGQHRAHDLRVGADSRAAMSKENLRSSSRGRLPVLPVQRQDAAATLTTSAIALFSTTLPQGFEQNNSSGDGDIEGLNGAGRANRNEKVASFTHQAAQA